MKRECEKRNTKNEKCHRMLGMVVHSFKKNVYIRVLVLFYNQSPIFIFGPTGNLFIALCKIIRSLSNRLLFEKNLVLLFQSRSHYVEKRTFCAFTCSCKTFEVGFLFLGLVFKRSYLPLKLANFSFVLWVLFLYFTCVYVRARSF